MKLVRSSSLPDRYNPDTDDPIISAANADQADVAFIVNRVALACEATVKGKAAIAERYLRHVPALIDDLHSDELREVVEMELLPALAATYGVTIVPPYPEHYSAELAEWEATNRIR